MSCPRCQAKQQDLRTEHHGKEAGEIVWTVYYCQRCAFTWRDSEPSASIDYEARDAWFRADPDAMEKYPHNIAPAKPKSARD